MRLIYIVGRRSRHRNCSTDWKKRKKNVRCRSSSEQRGKILLTTSALVQHWPKFSSIEKTFRFVSSRLVSVFFSFETNLMSGYFYNEARSMLNQMSDDDLKKIMNNDGALNDFVQKLSDVRRRTCSPIFNIFFFRFNNSKQRRRVWKNRFEN